MIDRVLLRFIIVGIINTICGYAIMFALYNIAGCGYWVSSATNYVVVSIASFFMNKYFTFRSRHWSSSMIYTFVITIVGSYVIAYGIARPLVRMALKDSAPSICDNIALVVGMCFFTGLNYLGQRLLVFKYRTGVGGRVTGGG